MADEASANRVIMLRSTSGIAALVIIACALIGFPYAMLIAAAEGWKRNLLLLLLLAAVLLPLWTSLLVLATAWFVIPQGKGTDQRPAAWPRYRRHAGADDLQPPGAW